MYVLDFVIPLHRDDLCESASTAQFSVSRSLPLSEIREALESAKLALKEEGIIFIVDHFITFFSLLKHKQVPDLLRQKGWRIILNSFKLLSSNISIYLEDISCLDSEEQRKMCNVSKMIVYIFIETMKMHQDLYTDQTNAILDVKGRKKQVKPQNDSGWDWPEERYTGLIEINNFVQLPLKFLWEPPIIEEEFVDLFANICYKCLEDQSLSSNNLKPTRSAIFSILGVLIKQYLHGLSFCLKSIQLLRIHEFLVTPLAQGIVQLVKECQCANVVKEIIREIASTDSDQMSADSGGTRSIGALLVQVTEALPETMMPAIGLLINQLSGESYPMRICVLGVLGEIILTILTKENLDESLKNKRDEFLNLLEDHVHDVNAFVRTKVLQIWQKLCMAKAVPVSRSNVLLELATGRLNDKSTNVKKQAIQLLKVMLECNPYSAQLNSEDIKYQLSEEMKRFETFKRDHNIKTGHEKPWDAIAPKIKELLEEVSEEEDKEAEKDLPNLEECIKQIGQHLSDGDHLKAVKLLLNIKKEFQAELGLENQDDDSLLPVLQKIYEQNVTSSLPKLSAEVLEQLDKHDKIVEYLDNALNFALLIDRALPQILTLLDSSVVTEVLESVHFFTAAYLFGFEQALEGVRKMLYLVFSKEASIKTAVSTAYQELYFQTNSGGRRDSLQAVKNLSGLVMKINASQMDALQEVVREWLRTDVIDRDCIQVMFEMFSKKIPGTSEGQSWAALVLIRMVGAEQPKVIKSNMSVLMEQGLSDPNSLKVKETCIALSRLLPTKQPGVTVDQSLRLPHDHEIFRYIMRALKNGLWRSQDHYYIPMAEEAINTIFILSKCPDKFCEDLLSSLHEKISAGKLPVVKKPSKTLANKNDFDALLIDDGEEPSEQINNEINEEQKTPEPSAPVELPPDTIVMLLARFLSILGQIAANYVLFLEGPVLDELKRRNQVEFERKLKKFQESKKLNASRKGRVNVTSQSSVDSIGDESRTEKNVPENGSEDLEFNRVAADDADSDEIKRRTEFEIVNGDGLLARYVPLILTICMNPGKYKNEALQNAALLALAKYMQVSSVFCEQHLQLLVTLCEKSQISSHRINGMVALGALQYRFPNTLEPWTPHMYAMLEDFDSTVRLNAIMVITDLIVNEMIKARSHISSLALCVIDDQIPIAQLARHFFKEFSQKGNSLYNVLPSLITNLTHQNLEEGKFRKVMEFILGLITKDKQVEYLVEKLCQYFECATEERQYKDLAYCLSLLTYNDKGLRKILENVRCFASKLYLADVYESFCMILTNAGKNQQKDKVLIDELQNLIHDYREKICGDKNISVTLPKKCPPSTMKKRARRKLMPSSEDDDDEDDGDRGTLRERVMRNRRKPVYQDDSLDEEDAFKSDGRGTKSQNMRSKTPAKPVQPSDSSSDDESPLKASKTKGRNIRKMSRKSKRNMDDSNSEDEIKERKPLRSTRKRK